MLDIFCVCLHPSVLFSTACVEKGEMMALSRGRSTTGFLLFVLGIASITTLRLLRIFPNNDPIIPGILPAAATKRFGAAVLLPLVSVLAFDLLTTGVSAWTGVVSVTYVLLTLLVSRLYKVLRRNGARIHGRLTYVAMGVGCVLLFDGITGILFPPLLWGLSFRQAVLGQIPFTLWHLSSVTVYAAVVSPVLARLFEHGWCLSAKQGTSGRMEPIS